MARGWRLFRRLRLILSCTDGECSRRGIAREFCSGPGGSSVVSQQRASAREMYSKEVERDATSWFALGGVVHPCSGARLRGAGLCEKQRLQSILSAATGRHI